MGRKAGTSKRSNLKLARWKSEAANGTGAKMSTDPAQDASRVCVSRHNAAKLIDEDRKSDFVMFCAEITGATL